LPLYYSIHPRKRNPADEESDTSENEEDEEDDDQEGAVTASDDDDEESESEEETTEDDGDDDDDDFEAAKPKKKKASGARNTTKASSKKTKIQIGKSSKSTKKTKPTTTTSKSSTAQGKINSALSTLSKHVLPPNEEPGLKSLIAGLLSSYRPPKSSQVANFASNVALNVTSPYTINLHSLAERVIEMHNDNPNKAQLALLNLLFRSVGGGPDTDLPMGGVTTTAATMDENGEEQEEEETDLEHMDTEEWAELVTDLVDDMRHAPANQILLCADPLGAVHQQNALNSHERDGGEGDVEEDEKKKGSKQYALGAAEFRKIYQEFWYILGYVALTEGGMATNTQQEEDDEDEEVSGSVVRLDAELVKELIGRVSELAPVGQPDVRAAAILAAISMSHAVLDQSAQLVKKMDVAKRQYKAAVKGENESKAEALKVRIDSLNRSAEDLQEVVVTNYVNGLFVHRYR